MLDWFFDKDWPIPVAAGVFIVALIVGVGYLVMEDEKQWQKFKAEHKCVVVGRMRGDVVTGTTVTTGGKVGVVTAVTPDKMGYKCDDGITYWR